MKQLNYKKILIVRLSSIGDTVHSLPILYAIKTLYPDSMVSWIVEKQSSFLLINNKMLDNVFIFDKDMIKNNKNFLNKIKYLFGLIKSIQKEKFDIVIDLQGLLKSGIITFLSKAPIRVGFKHTREFADLFLTDKIDVGNLFDTNEHIIEKNLKLLNQFLNEKPEVKCPLPNSSEEIINKVNTLIPEINNKINVGILPATLWQTKHWAKEYWTDIIQNISKDANVYIIGSEKDNELINSITKEIPHDQYHNIAGKTNLLDLIEVFKRMSLVIGVDTGPLHIAVAVNKPKIIGIFGPTSHIRTGAYNHSNVISNVGCQPCNKKRCPLNKDQQMQCMKKLTPNIVLEVYNKLKREL